MSRLTWAAVLLGALALPAGAQVAPATDAPAPTAEEGRRIYVGSCTRCHGINLVTTGSAYFDLRSFPANDKERFMRSVAKGLRAMPAWEGTLKPGQIESLWLYIGSVTGWPSAATPQGPARTP